MRRLLPLALLALASPAVANDPPAWTEATAPFHIAGPIYYVGTKGLASYLIATPAGLILLDAPMAENVDRIEANIRTLGFRIGQVKLLLENHAHFDHVGGLAKLKADSGARLIASAGDRWALEHGTPRGETSYGVIRFPAVKVDRLVRDGETIRLGGVEMRALLTPGHTPGCTTWAMAVTDHGRRLRVVFPCSLTVAGNKLVGNREYPTIAADFRRSLARIATVKADIVLPGHPEAADVMGREARVRAGEANAFIDPAALPNLVSAATADFAEQWRKASSAK